MRLKGLKTMTKNMTSFEKNRLPRAYRVAILKALLLVEAESMRRTPVDTGNLRSSAGGNSRITKANRQGASGEMGYTANYAVHVHERTDLHHTNGEAKFLQNAISAVLPKLPNEIGMSIKATTFTGTKKL
jgi:hypothetical protein